MTLDDLFTAAAENRGATIDANLTINSGDFQGSYKMTGMVFEEQQFSQVRTVQTLSGQTVLPGKTHPPTSQPAMLMVITRTIANDVVHNPVHPTGPRESYQVVVTHKSGGVVVPPETVIDQFTPELTKGSSVQCAGLYFHSLVLGSGNHPGGKPLIECCLTQS